MEELYLSCGELGESCRTDRESFLINFSDHSCFGSLDPLCSPVARYIYILFFLGGGGGGGGGVGGRELVEPVTQTTAIWK